jgi:hypothetical protein
MTSTWRMRVTVGASQGGSTLPRMSGDAIRSPTTTSVTIPAKSSGECDKGIPCYNKDQSRAIHSCTSYRDLHPNDDPDRLVINNGFDKRGLGIVQTLRAFGNYNVRFLSECWQRCECPLVCESALDD